MIPSAWGRPATAAAVAPPEQLRRCRCTQHAIAVVRSSRSTARASGVTSATQAADGRATLPCHLVGGQGTEAALGSAT